MNTVSIIALCLFGGLWLLFVIRMGYKLYRNQFAKPKTVAATVVNKHTVDFYNKSLPHQTATRYVVTFSVNQGTKALYVSSGSYSQYKTGQQGTLTYRGDGVISFQ